MPTIEQQLTELVNQKNALATNLNTKGVTASSDETLNTLVPKVLDIETGGGGDSGGEYLVQVIDYDGTVLKSDRLDEGATFTLPDAPTNHSKLVFQEWSSPVTITDNSITVGNSDITIGATYKTASGLTEIDIVLTKATGLEVTCKMVGNKNWGDGITNSEITHTYVDYGEYTITCDGTSIPAGSSSSAGMFGGGVDYCVAIRIGELVASIGNYAFYSCSSLSSVTIPNSVISIGAYVFEACFSLNSITLPNSITTIMNNSFYFCYSLTSITIPSSITNIYANAFYGCYSLNSITIPKCVTSIISSILCNCYSLKSITIPDNVTSIGTYAFHNCYSLSSVTIPDNITSIEIYAFNSCYSLSSITIPSSITTISGYAFRYCYSLIKYDFTNCTSIPTLSSTSAFNGMNQICKIYVPDALYDDWIVATNWATYADHVYKASEMED